MPTALTCETCQSPFALPESVQAKFPGWVPRQCMRCRDARKPASGAVAGKPAAPKRAVARRSATATLNLTPEEVLERYHLGPKDGVFTDGGASPNPGAGGWGCVLVRDDVLVEARHGSAPDTTNNRMELTAMIEALRLLPPDSTETIHADSELVVNTVSKWAAQWERAGWKRKTGAIKNLDLVQELHGLAKARPGVKYQWVPAHAGWRWNEYADALASSHLRPEAGA